MIVRLSYYPITHAGILPVFHQHLGTTIDGQQAVRYLRFMRRVKVERLELGRTFYARHEPYVPTHPAHVIVSVRDASHQPWETLRTKVSMDGKTLDVTHAPQFRQAPKTVTLHIPPMPGLKTAMVNGKKVAVKDGGRVRLTNESKSSKDHTTR